MTAPERARTRTTLATSVALALTIACCADVLYSSDLEASDQAVVDAGGRIVEEAFAFPGGRRFHFEDPSGNVLAVWSET